MARTSCVAVVRFLWIPIACEIYINVHFEAAIFIGAKDEASVAGTFKISSEPLDCLSVFYLGCGGETGALMGDIGDITASASFEVVELTKNGAIIEFAVEWW